MYKPVEKLSSSGCSSDDAVHALYAQNFSGKQDGYFLKPIHQSNQLAIARLLITHVIHGSRISGDHTCGGM